MNGITRPRLHAIFQDAVRASGADVRLGVTVDGGRRGRPGRRSPTAVPESTTSSSARTASTPWSAASSSRTRPSPSTRVRSSGATTCPDRRVSTRSTCSWASNGKAGFVPLAPDLMYILYIEAVPPDRVKMPEDRLAEIFRERLAEFGGPVGRGARPLHHRRRRRSSFGRSSRCSSRRRGTGAASSSSATPPTRPRRTSARAVRWRSRTPSSWPRRSTGDDDLESALRRYTDRRYPRCREIWEISRQIGVWEIEHTPPPEADFVGLTMKSIHVTAAPV